MEKISSENMSSNEKVLWKLIPEEPAAIRALNPKDAIDFERYQEIDRSPESQKWMIGEEMDEEEIKEFLASHPQDIVLYAVSGKKSEGELEGWVQLLPEGKERINRIKKEGVADLSKNHLILELSYARYFNPKLKTEENEKGLISSGIRQICYLLGLVFNKKDKADQKSQKPMLKPKIDVVAYTDPQNEPSERVLEKSGFKKLGQIKYEPDDQVFNNFWLLDWGELNSRYVNLAETRMPDLHSVTGLKILKR